MYKKGIIIAPEDMNGVDYLQKAATLGLNTLAFHTGGPNHNLLDALKDVRTEEFREKCRQAGLNCEYEEHAAGQFLPAELFESHPEYFACNREGIRQCGKNTGWCLSSAGMKEYITESAENLARELQTASHNYYFWGEDDDNALCRCPACSRYSIADLNILNANAIAEGIRRVDPLANVSLLAYSSGTFELPEKVEPHEALFLEFAPYRRHYDCAFDDPADEVNTKFRKDLLKLLQYYPAERTHVLEYWLDVSYFSHYTTPLKKVGATAELMKRDLEFYYSCGIRNFSTFAAMMNKEYFDEFGEEELNVYAELLNQMLGE